MTTHDTSPDDWVKVEFEINPKTGEMRGKSVIESTNHWGEKKYKLSLLPDKELPYLYSYSIKQKKKINPEYPKNAECECGHSYERHFDPYENWEAVGCKYCSCFDFKPKNSV